MNDSNNDDNNETTKSKSILTRNKSKDVTKFDGCRLLNFQNPNKTLEFHVLYNVCIGLHVSSESK